MSFIIPKKAGNFLNAKLVRDKKLAGKTGVITGEGEITDFTNNEGKTKSVWNIPIDVEDQVYTFTPNATNLDIMTEAWGREKEVDGVMQKGIEQKDVVGKIFKINLVKVRFRKDMVDSIQIEPLKEEKVIERKKEKVRKL